MQTIIHRMDKQEGLTVLTIGNYIQYPVIIHNGKEKKNVTPTLAEIELCLYNTSILHEGWW